MPKLTPSELLQIHEIASSYATSIAKLTAYVPFVQEPDLQTMLDHARHKAETHYDELIDIANGQPLDSRFESLDGGLKGRPKQMPSGSPKPVQPNPGQGFTDRTIASDCLDSSKAMAIRTVWAATEISHVGLRRALSEMSRYHLDAAYEFYRFMEAKGWYVPLTESENAQRWFQQNHDPIQLSVRQDREWAQSPSHMPS